MLRYSGRCRNGWALAACVVLLLASGCAAKTTPPERAMNEQPEREQKLQLLNETADQMYQSINRGEVLEARNKLLAMSDQVTQIRFDGVTSAEGLNAFTQLLTEAKRIYNSASFSPEQGKLAAARIRLAADALTHAHQPMWRQYGHMLEEQLNRMAEAVDRYNKTAAAAAFKELEQHYQMIRPALLISRQPDEVEKTDSLFMFLQNQLGAAELQSSQLATGIAELRRTFDQMFREKEETAYLPLAETQHPIVRILGIGLAIVLVLSYVAWRMFGTEKSLVIMNRKK